ncbi:D-glycero-beta-D-manno-heptose 1,7-bisphosphate 7-phosphatase, partial [Neisseria sp. P0015.S010]
MKLIILDRDGVINQDRDDFVKSVDEWIPIEGSMDAIAF